VFAGGVVLALGAAIVVAAAPAQAMTGLSARFAAQQSALGLSQAQARTLQVNISHDLAVLGGTQVSINEVDFSGGYIVEPLPGRDPAEALARFDGDGASDVAIPASGTCFVGDFCVWSGVNRTGAFLAKYLCSPFSIPWVSDGSWLNNQTGGAKARFYNGSGTLIFTTPAPVSSDNSYDWSLVFTVDPC
jgi:hypothetical protein